MRFTTILVGAFAVLAAAQSTSTTATTATTTAAGNAAASSAQSQMIQCINACQAGDVACTSKCIAVSSVHKPTSIQERGCCWVARDSMKAC